jgi:FkbM family methyltransferase
MPNLAGSPLTPLLGRLPIRGPARLLNRAYAARPPSGQRIASNTFGDRLHVDLRSMLEWQVWTFGYYELETLRLITSLVGPGSTMLDIGANVGIMTIRAARQGARVIAIEPDPALVQRLRANAELNGLHDVEVVAAAATAEPGVVMLHRAGGDNVNRGLASLLQHHHHREALEVPGITVDSLGLDSVTLVKIDVEGAEAGVVAGAWDTIDRCRPHLLFEMTHDYSTEYGFVNRLRDDLGYELTAVEEGRHRVTGRVHGPVMVPLEQRSGHGNVLAVPQSRSC